MSVGGDFMRGRFLAVPMVAGVCLLVSPGMLRPVHRALATAGVVALGFLVPTPTILSGSNLGLGADRSAYRKHHGIASEPLSYFQVHGLFNAKPLARKLGADMAALREQQARNRNRVDLVYTAGANGFAAGPGVFVLDVWALGDALLARLPMVSGPGSGDSGWRVGHYARAWPAGYPMSVLTGTNRIVDARVHEYYDKLRLVTRGPLFDRQRWVEIVKLNMGRYDALLRGHRDYAAVGAQDYVDVIETDLHAGGMRILWGGAQHYLDSGDFDRAWPVLEEIRRRDDLCRATFVFGVGALVSRQVLQRLDPMSAEQERLLRWAVDLDAQDPWSRLALGALLVRSQRVEEGKAFLALAAQSRNPDVQAALRRLETGSVQAP